MEESSENVIKNKPAKRLCLRRKIKIAAGIIFLCILAGLIYRAMTWSPSVDFESQKASDIVIRNTAAEQIGKNINELTDDDIAEIQEFHFNDKMPLSDFQYLEKFTNLRRLWIIEISFPQNEVPKWMKYLGKYGFLNMNERFAFDLSPLKKLNKLERLYIQSTNVKNIKSLESLTNLQELRLINTHVTNLEPFKGLTNLQILDVENNQVFDLEPLKKLKNLKYLDLSYCPNITEEQIEELQMALPNLEIKKIK